MLARKPANLTFEHAAALPTVGITAYQAIVVQSEVAPGRSVFIHGCLGGVGRTAARLALARGAFVAGSCRPAAADDARALGIDPVVDFEFDPTGLAGRFDLVLLTADTLSPGAATALVRPGGRVLDIHPTPHKLVRGSLPGPFRVLTAQPVVAHLEEVASAAAEGVLRVPVARHPTLPPSSSARQPVSPSARQPVSPSARQAAACSASETPGAGAPAQAGLVRYEIPWHR